MSECLDRTHGAEARLGEGKSLSTTEETGDSAGNIKNNELSSLTQMWERRQEREAVVLSELGGPLLQCWRGHGTFTHLAETVGILPICPWPVWSPLPTASHNSL